MRRDGRCTRVPARIFNGMEMNAEHKNPKQAAEVSFYEKRKKIHAKRVRGFFDNWRIALVIITQLIFYGTPWLMWNDRQAILFHLVERKFYIFGLVFWPQDVIYLAILLIISAYALFLVTAVAGRLFCGYACPQTVYTQLFMWIENWIEGDRNARLKLDNAPMNARKFRLRASKFLLWGALALWTGFTLVGYFTPMHELIDNVLSNNLGPWETVWIFLYGGFTFLFAGFMREQVCKYMCPYARFQSAMFDKDTMIVTYDEARGEPRGARKKSADPKALGLGECVDCTLCVQVCPTGIDIRKGLQYECIGCGACIDACDEVMEKVGYPKGLIKYSTQNGMANGWSTAQMVRRALRPRVLIYTGILAAICVAVGVSLFMRVPLKVDVIRDRGALARQVEYGFTENVYRLQIMNATESAQRYALSVEGLPGLKLVSEPEIEVLSTEVRSVAVRVQLPPGAAAAGSHPVHFTIRSLGDDPHAVTEKAAFLVPR